MGGLNPQTFHLGTPVGFTLSRQQRIRGASEEKFAQVYDAL